MLDHGCRGKDYSEKLAAVAPKFGPQERTVLYIVSFSP